MIRRSSTALALICLGLVAPACGGGDDPSNEDDGNDPSSSSSTGGADECATSAECPDPATSCEGGACVPTKAGEIGRGDGSTASVVFTKAWQTADEINDPTDIGFNPSKPTETWLVNWDDDAAIIIQNIGTPEMTFERRRDPAAEHFMQHPPAFSFGVVIPEWGQTFATCGDDDVGGGSAKDFIGPALFTANLDIFAKPTPTGLGSHLDMLHATSFCRGIDHVADNQYFAFNAQKGALDKYNFVADHGPGNDDHSDGEIWRYVEGEVAGVDGVMSHVDYDPATQMLYVADTGHQRITKLDTTTGTEAGNFPGLEPVQLRKRMEGAVMTEVVPPGTLQEPSGIELRGEYLFVSDSATSRFYAFSLDGQVVRTLDTGLPPGSLAGFTFGPTDGKLYFVDRLNDVVWRIDAI
jgi:hypothetical protein